MQSKRLYEAVKCAKFQTLLGSPAGHSPGGGLTGREDSTIRAVRSVLLAVHAAWLTTYSEVCTEYAPVLSSTGVETQEKALSYGLVLSQVG